MIIFITAEQGQVYDKLEGKSCSKWYGNFRNIQDAEDQCSKSQYCKGVYADRCDRSRSNIHLCKTWGQYLDSSNGSCVYTKIGI